MVLKDVKELRLHPKVAVVCRVIPSDLARVISYCICYLSRRSVCHDHLKRILETNFWDQSVLCSRSLTSFDGFPTAANRNLVDEHTTLASYSIIMQLPCSLEHAHQSFTKLFSSSPANTSVRRSFQRPVTSFQPQKSSSAASWDGGRTSHVQVHTFCLTQISPDHATLQVKHATSAP
jgi:hypothetical protein